MVDVRESLKRGRTFFEPGLLELAVPDDVRVGVKEFQLQREAARLFTLEGSLSAVTRTLGPFTGQLHNGAGERMATLDAVTATVTRMTGQQGQSFLMYTLEYSVTSHGWRTGDGRQVGPSVPYDTPGREPIGASEQVMFQNSSGGTMTTWFLGTDAFELRCGDARRYRSAHRAEHQFLGWFDEWTRFTHYVHGAFFPCQP
jgi:hypothetical protein